MRMLLRAKPLVGVAAVALVCVFLSLAFGRGGEEEEAYYRTDDVVQMAEQIEQLVSRVGGLESRLALLERDSDATTDDVADTPPWDVAGGFKPDRLALERIPPLTRWTVEEVDDYVGQILDVSSRGNHLYQDDPQIRMLAAVGPDHLSSLLNALGTRLGAADGHLGKAIAHVVSEEHRELILEYLPFQWRLASIVVMHGWEDDAVETLIRGLYRDEYLPHAWLLAASRYNDQRVDEGLVRYFYYGLNFTSAYYVLRSWPDIDLDALVAEAWAVRKTGRPSETAMMAEIAASHGIAEALEVLARFVLTGQPQGCGIGNVADKLQVLVKHGGSATEIAEFILENPDRLRYDPVVKCYQIE